MPACLPACLLCVCAQLHSGLPIMRVVHVKVQEENKNDAAASMHSALGNSGDVPAEDSRK